MQVNESAIKLTAQCTTAHLQNTGIIRTGNNTKKIWYILPNNYFFNFEIHTAAYTISYC